MSHRGHGIAKFQFDTVGYREGEIMTWIVAGGIIAGFYLLIFYIGKTFK